MANLQLTSSGVDNLTGTNGDDIITGTTATWQAGDVIAAGFGNDQLKITALSAATAKIGDALFANVHGLEDLVLFGKFAETVQVGALSDAAGLTEIDGSHLKGNLAVNASTRIDGITVDTSQGAENLTGGVGDDVFRFTSAGLTAADKVNGGGTGDNDMIEITNKAAIADTAFTHVTNVEHLGLGGGTVNYAGQKVTLGAHSVAAGLNEVDVLDSQGATVNAAARALGIAFHGGIGDDVFVGSQGNDTFLGGAGNDSYWVKETKFTNTDLIDGGAGHDQIRFVDATAAILDVAFASTHSVESLVCAAPGKETISLGAFADAAGIDAIDASKMTGNLNLTIGNAFINTLTVDLGNGADTVQLGDGGTHTVVMKSTSLNASDTITGNSGFTDTLEFNDAVKISDKFFLGASGVHNFSVLDLASDAKGQTFIAGTDFSAFVSSDGLKAVTSTSNNPNESITLDFRQYNGPDLTVTGGGGHDVIIGSSVKGMQYFGASPFDDQTSADTFEFRSKDLDASNLVLGASNARASDMIVLDDQAAISDADFTLTGGISILRLAAATSGGYTVTLGSHAEAGGLATIDASKAGVAVSVDVSAFTNDAFIAAGSKDNFLIGGSGDDSFTISAATLNSGDVIHGGTSAQGDRLFLTSGGTVSAAALANVKGVELIECSGLGNSVTLSDAFLGSNEGISRTIDGFASNEECFVYTGQGKDKVDLSQLSAWAEKKGEEGLAEYQRRKNGESIDGLPALRWVTADAKG